MFTTRTRREWVLLALVGLLLAACAGRQTSVPQVPPQEVTAQPKPNPGPAEGVPDRVYPPGTRTNIEPVDRILEAVASRDPDKVFAYVKLTNIPCSTNVQDYSPWCKEGQADGTESSVFMFGACRAMWESDPDVVRTTFKTRLAPPLYVYAVYKMNRELSKSVMTTYEVVLAHNADDSSVVKLGVDEDGAIRVMTQCGGTSEVPKSSDFVLAPRN